MARLNEKIMITRPPLTADGKGGYTAGVAATLFDGYGDVSEAGRAFDAALRADSLLQDRGGAVVEVMDDIADEVRAGDDMTITFYDGQTQAAKIRRVVRRGPGRGPRLTVLYNA